MTRTLLVLVVLAGTIRSARADDAEAGTVEIIRPHRTRSKPSPQPKELEIPPEEAAAAPAPEAAKEKPAPDDAEARARAERLRQIEELARQTQEEYRKASNALVGGE